MNQPPAEEGDTNNLMFADTDVQGPKATERNSKNISIPQVAQTAEKMRRGWGEGKGTLHSPAN